MRGPIHQVSPDYDAVYPGFRRDFHNPTAYFINDCLNQAQLISLMCIHVYTCYLIFLFAHFYRASYIDKKPKGEKLN